MKRLYTLSIIVSFCLLALLALSGTQAQDRQVSVQIPHRVAVCNVAEVFSQYAKAKELALAVSEAQRTATAEDEKRAKAIQNLELTIEGLKPGSPEHEKQTLELIRAKADRQTVAQIEAFRLQREYNRRTVEMYASIASAVADVSKEVGIAVVLQTQSQEVTAAGAADPVRVISARQVLYNHPAVDITRDVVAKLNTRPADGGPR